jgi:hypothetical protein
MTSSAFPWTPARRATCDLGSTVWLFALSLGASASLLPLRLLEQRGAVEPHWIYCTGIVALTALMATIAIRTRRQSRRQKHEPVDIPEGGGWFPDLAPRDAAVLPKLDVVSALEVPNQSRVLAWFAAERQTGVALARLRVQHQLRDPLHHARMIVSDLEAIGGPPDRLEQVRSLRAHIDEISRTVGGGELRASFAACLGERPSSSGDLL